MTGARPVPLHLPRQRVVPFPDPRPYDHEGLLAFGGDLSVARLQLAYRSGVFPWYGEGLVPLWWSPDPRGVIDPTRLHVPRRLQRVLRAGAFTLTWNQCFRVVMEECGRQRAEGTWVLPEMVTAYTALHAAGGAHSLEVWHDAALVGGVYGVQVGALFAAESMFHRRTDMSKVALVALVRSLAQAGVELFDVQFVTPHLQRLGAQPLPRTTYLDRLLQLRDRQVDLRAPELRVD
ncbi:MAG: leucyl/phenylalanyl-tRNA--protein transferase [Planctomycetes bacterium]|nr:leucyl/phenylalanyl-tRNA--protein transferase [Planctomycetota bacterium]